MSQARDLKWIEVDLAAIAKNTAWVVSRLEKRTRLMAVVKTDAYGHGAPQVSRVALKAGAASLGVRDLSEAAELRRAGIRAPIHLLFPLLADQAPEAVRLGVSVTVDDAAQARALNAAARGRKIGLHVDVDSGLGRWGVAPRDLAGLMGALKRLRRVRVEGLSTHIDYVPGKNGIEAEEKLTAFAKLSAPYKKKDPALTTHAANSSVVMDFSHHRFDMACVGNLLYGINPSGRVAPLANAWRFQARVVSVRAVRKGQSIGYASEYLAPRRMVVATLPVGYADGLTMEPAERLIGFGAGFAYWGMRQGVKLPFVGRCGIAHVLVDATDAPDIRPGDAVSLPVRRTAARHLPRLFL